MISVAVLAGCQNSGDSERTLAPPGIYSGGDRHWINALDVIAADCGDPLSPRLRTQRCTIQNGDDLHEDDDAKHDSITFLLAQDRSTKRYFVIVWDSRHRDDGAAKLSGLRVSLPSKSVTRMCASQRLGWNTIHLTPMKGVNGKF